ncbi:MAG: NADH:ubiquinone reductase (Na(+)-transporting) subunit F [Bacteroidales bacterium]|nr:NADH:ubiquinone reductase (Na(+)-transporting) subunit F [Bacteroidales bacterium]
MQTLIVSVVACLALILLLVALLLFVKAKLTPSGTVKIDINDGKKVVDVPQGGSLLATLADQKIFLPSACGGKGSCGQCKCRVLEGGGSILPTETVHFSRKQINDHWRLGCQVKVKDNLKIEVPDSALSVKKLECEVISNDNVATFIKEFTVKLPEGEDIEFKSGEYIQIDIPAYDADFSTIDVDPIYKADWEKYGFFDIKYKNTVPTIRAYSMASYPAEKGVIKLNVRIATPPFDRSQPKGVFKMLPVPPGIGSTYVFTRKPGDKVMISGPYGEFLLPKDDPDDMEYIFVGGGAGMAPLRSHIMHLFKTLKTKREVHFFYGARALVEAFYLEDFAEIEKEFPNFHFHLALDRPDPAADAAGVKYTAGFVHQVMNDTYLKDHEAPEDIKYFMCGPPMMVGAVNGLLDSLGVPPESILYDNFG